jgi:hypothetical protein
MGNMIGKTSHCKECMKQNTKDNYNPEYQKAWLKAHPGYGRQAHKKWLRRKIKKAVKAYIRRTVRNSATEA